MRQLCRTLAAVTILLACASARGLSQTHPNPTAASAPKYRTPANAALAVTPEQVGLSSQRLDRIGDAIKTSINDGRIAGAVSLVARHDKIVYFKAFGMADREAGKPMRTDNIFRICSMSKPITTAAVMTLYEEGRFTLNEPVFDFIPEFKKGGIHLAPPRHVGSGRPMTSPYVVGPLVAACSIRRKKSLPRCVDVRRLKRNVNSSR